LNRPKLEILDNRIVYDIDGVKYLTANDFAKLLDRSRQSIDTLIRHGNRIRKMKSYHDDKNKIYVPLSEVTEFPFCMQGIDGHVYHYSLTGKRIVTDKKVSEYLKEV
jgi:hypothetical protein